MTTVPTTRDLSVQAHLQQVSATMRPRLGVDPPGPPDVEEWRTALRAKLHDLLADVATEVDAALEVVETEDCGTYAQSLVRYQTEPGVAASAWLLVPHAAQAGPVSGVLALHGHGRGKDNVVGRWPAGDAEAEDGVRVHHYDYARQLARRGYVVLAPDARGFGERAADGCHVSGLLSLYYGRPVAGQRLWDDRRSLDLLAGLPQVDSDRLGCVGLSEGGKRTLLLAALDDRVAAAVVSGYFTSIRLEAETWERLNGWDICNAVPGLLAWADLPDIAALVAPRSLMIQHGRNDGLYTLAHVERGFDVLPAMWERCGRPDRVGLEVFDGEHRWHGETVYDWIATQLDASAPRS